MRTEKCDKLGMSRGGVGRTEPAAAVDTERESQRGRRGRKVPLLQVFFGAWLFSAYAAAEAPEAEYRSYHVVEAQKSCAASGSCRRVITIQEGENTFNRYRTVHLSVDGASRKKTSVLLLSPFGFPSEFWEIPDGSDPESGFAPSLVREGYDVWLVDNRLAQAEPGQCESGVSDCSPMVDWGIGTGVSDALYVRRLMGAAVPGNQVVIGGFSGGSSTALAVVNTRPHRFAGLFLWEGTLLTSDPSIQQRNLTFCQDDRAALSQGAYFDSSVQVFQTLFSLAKAAPAALSPVPLFPPGTTNLSALLMALTLPSPTNPLNFNDTFVRHVGDPFVGTLAYSDIPRVLELGPLIGNYASIAFIRDSHCGMAGLDTTFTDRLSRFRGRALVYAEGRGFGSMMEDTAAALTGAEVTLEVHPDLGESDGYFNREWRSVALEPLLDWLRASHCRKSR